jgi:hypothetical protein
VHTTYFTATVDSEGKVQSFADVYSLDAGVAAAILGNAARQEAVADNVEVKAPEVKPKPPKPSTLGSPPPASGFAGAAP